LCFSVRNSGQDEQTRYFRPGAEIDKEAHYFIGSFTGKLEGLGGKVAPEVNSRKNDQHVTK
jgi:hypothetical protein